MSITWISLPINERVGTHASVRAQVCEGIVGIERLHGKGLTARRDQATLYNCTGRLGAVEQTSADTERGEAVKDKIRWNGQIAIPV